MKIKLALVAFMAMFVFVGCGDDDEKKKGFSNEPTAKAANDEKGEGIYKAVIVGSTGSILFNMNNEGNGISAVLKLDGVTYNLHTDGEFDQDGEFGDYFFGTMEEEDDIEIYFEVESDGGDAYIEFNIPGHDITYEIYKELSTHIVIVYEGTYSVMGQTGAMNIVATMDAEGAGDFYGVANLDGAEVTYYLEGGITVEQSVKILAGGGGVFTIAGTISGNNISGSCSKGEGQGTWSAKRTL